MSSQSEELKRRTAEFARRIIALCNLVSPTQAGRTATGQLIDAATSVAMNYRATCRARSQAEFISKMGLVVEEADECVGWLSLMRASGLLDQERMSWEVNEADELVAIFSASYRTSKENRKRNDGRHHDRR
jgi:four helix bundle protein